MQLQSPKWTYILIGLSILGFVVRSTYDQWLYLAFFPQELINYPWMIITSIFLHADLNHLFFNMFALFFLGINLERMIGQKRFLMLFLISGIIGNIGYLLYAYALGDPRIPAIGASGAVYGVMGILAMLRPKMMIFIYGLIPMPMILVTILWGIGDIVGLFAPSGIAHGAHLGGLFVGVLYGLALRQRISRRRIYYESY